MSNCTDFGCLWYSNNYKKDTSLKDVLGDKFLIGVALNTRQSLGVDTASVKIVKQHFNAVVAVNCMKHAIIHPEEDRYDFGQADEFVKFGEDKMECILPDTALLGIHNLHSGSA